jgi:DNA-binding LacI/PurR family transcriptional regulator
MNLNRALTLSKVDHSDPTPKYLQAREILLAAIRTGQVAPGSKLPSTEEISSLVDVSLITAHKALEGLVEMGWLRREVGRGTYVRDDVNLTDGAQRRLFLGLLFDHQEHVNIGDYYHSTLINGLRQAARADRTRHVEFFFHDGFHLHDKARRRVGAICIHPPLESQPGVECLAQHFPVVVLGGSYHNTRAACVDCDNESGAREAVRHLLGLGHRRFMVLSGPMSLSNARDRAEGATGELAAHGIALAERDRPVSRDSVILDEKTKAQVEQRMVAADRPTAIVAGGFYLALAAMQAVRQAGLSVPADVSIVGFDDPASAALLDPPLTTVRQPLAEMASEAYRLICQAIVAKSGVGAKIVFAPPSRKLATELVIRGSTRPIPKETPA